MTTPTTVNVRLKLRSDTAANWTSANPTLLSGELGRETDTGKIKIGNGSTAWTALAYQPFGAPITNADISATAEIAVSKLADGTARQLLQTDAAGTGVEWASNVDIPGTLDVTGAATFDAAVTIAGDLTVNGTTTTINTQDLLVEDKNIIIGNVATPTDLTADGGGITLKGATDKTINWVDATDAWTSSERFSYPLGSATAPSLTFTGDPNTGIYSPGANQVSVATGGTERLRIDAAGQIEAVSLGSAAAPAYSWTGDPNTGIYSPGADQVAISTNGTERARIDSSGRLLVGTSTSIDTGSFNNGAGGRAYTYLQLAGNDYREGSISLSSYQNASNISPQVSLNKSRSGTTGSFGGTALGASDDLGQVVFSGDDGSKFVTAAVISCEVDGTPGTDDMPGRIVFSTTADGASSPTERLRIDSAGQIEAGSLGTAAAPVWSFLADPNTGIYSPGADQVAISTNGTERARIDSSGRLLVGTSSAYTTSTGVTPQNQLAGLSNDACSSIIYNFQNDATTSGLTFAKSRGGSLGSQGLIADGNTIGSILFEASDGTQLRRAALISAAVDGPPGTNDMPGRLVFSTTADGASSPTERFRITNDGVIAHDQPAPAAVNATATLTIANLKAGIITSTSAAATDMTLPTGTDTQAGFSGTYDNFTFEWSVINTGPSLVRVLAGTAHTIVGSGSVATGTSGRFASRRTAANTFVTYRLS